MFRSLGPLIFSLVIWFSAISNLDGSRAGWGGDDISFVRYLPAVATTGYLLMAIHRGLSRRLLFVVMIALIVIFGGLVAHFVFGRELAATYFGRGLSMSFICFGYILARENVGVDRLTSLSRLPLIMASLLMLSAIVLSHGGIFPLGVNDNGRELQLYHAEIYFVVALPFFYSEKISESLRLLLLFSVLICVILNQKTTSLLVALAVTALFIWQFIYRRQYRSQALIYLRAASILLFVIVLSAGVSIVFGQKLDDSEEQSVRVRSFATRSAEIVKSPFFGQGFTGDPLIELTPTLTIPSHLDLLDLFSQGGILWFAPFIYLWFRALRAGLKASAQDARYMPFTATFVAATVVITVNPILALPRLSFFVMFLFGYFLRIEEKLLKRSVRVSSRQRLASHQT